jgi:hypothetical protein
MTAPHVPPLPPELDWTPRKRRRKWPWFVGAGVIAFVVVVSIIGSSDEPTDTPAPAAAPGADPSPLLAPTPHHVGPLAERRAAYKSLTTSITHYRQLLAQGQKIVGTTQYADGVAGLAAMDDPTSAAAMFRDYRQKPDPERDLTFLAAFKDADQHFTAETEPQAISDWQDDMGTAQSDLSQWVNVVVDYQISKKTQGDLDSAAATVEADLAKAATDAKAVERG